MKHARPAASEARPVYEIERLSKTYARNELVALSDVNEVDKARCSHFIAFASPSLLSYHFAKLREAGITRMRVEGTSRYLSIPREELDQRFPGLIDSVIATARRDPNLPRLGPEWLSGGREPQGQTSSG